MNSNHPSNREGGNKRNHKIDLNRTRQVELALAISIILSNLSNDEEYIKVLLGVDEWKAAWLQEANKGGDYESEGDALN